MTAPDWILEVDLETRNTQALGTLTDFAAVMGGRGLGQALLAKRVTPTTNPLAPECPVIISAGLLCGTGAPAAARLSLDSVNLFTGGVASSNVGGEAAAGMRRAGIASVVLSGRAQQLTVIELSDQRVRCHDAQELAGKSVPEVDHALRCRFGADVSTMVVGPAGEKGVWLATVVVDGARTAGRCGLGAVLGWKRVKALVIRGQGRVPVGDSEGFRRASAVAQRKLERSSFNRRRMKYGVYCYEVPWEVESPYRNFSGTAIPQEKIERLHPNSFLPYLKACRGCDGCPISCWTTHIYIDKQGVERRCEGLQGNDPDNFGARLDLVDPRDILSAHALCNELGLDVDVASSVIAWAIDCYESGLLSRAETDGRRLHWGDCTLVMDLLGAIARREGVGDLLAEGCVRAARRLGRGSEGLCRHVRGNDLFECLWTSPAWAFGTVLSPRGGTHTRGAFIGDRMADLPLALVRRWYGIEELPESGSWEHVERLVIHQERVNAVLDSIGMCFFTSSGCADMLLPEDYCEILSAFWGRPYTEHEFLLSGERIHVQERALNRLLGLPGRSGDGPPTHFVDVPLDNRYTVDPVAWNSALDRYYEMRGWDIGTGWPTGKTMLRLGLGALDKRIRHYEEGEETDLGRAT